MECRPIIVREQWKNMEIGYHAKSIIYQGQSDFQNICVADTFEFGKMLVLDGIVQTTERDEFYYHEMMVHVPFTAHGNPERVLVIGGGDGGILKEVLRYPSVKSVHLIEIDAEVIDICKKYLPAVSGNAFDDPRLKIMVEDGASYVASCKEKYDIVIIDSPDPVGPAKILFMPDFYRDISGLLSDNAIMVRQTGCLQGQSEIQINAHAILKDIFKHHSLYAFTVPTYIGGLFSSVFCSNSIDPASLSFNEIETRWAERNLQTSYYNPGIHFGAFQLPPFLQRRLSKNQEKT